MTAEELRRALARDTPAFTGYPHGEDSITMGHHHPAQSCDEILASHMADLAAGRTFGEALVRYTGEPELPFLVRLAAGKAVRSVVAQWEAAGRPIDVKTLKTLFPLHAGAREAGDAK